MIQFNKIFIQLENQGIVHHYIRGKDWAEPTGAVLKAAANVARLLPPPAGGVIKGALNLGGALLNPDPTLADLRRAKEDIQEEVRGSFKEVAQEMSEIRDDLTDVRDNVEVLIEIVTEQEFKRGIEEVESNHEYFLKGVENLEKTIEEFKPQAVLFQTAFKRNFRIKKLFNYLKIVKSREGNEACEATKAAVLETMEDICQEIKSLGIVLVRDEERALAFKGSLSSEQTSL